MLCADSSVQSNDQMFHLLNVVNSIDWIIHFLPAIGQLYQQQRDKQTQSKTISERQIMHDLPVRTPKETKDTFSQLTEQTRLSVTRTA